jgi:transposase
VSHWRGAAVVSVSAFTVDVLSIEEAEEVRSAVDWAEVRAMHADGVTKREIARRLGISRNTVDRLIAAEEPPRYSRAPAGSMLDPLEGVLRRLIEEVPDIKAPRVTEILREDYGFAGSVDLVRKRLATLRPPRVRPAQRTGYRPGQVLQLDWGEMPTRPRMAGRERRIYALVATLPYSGAQSAHFSFDLTAESFLEGHVRIFDWLGGVVRECVYDNLRSAVARRERDQITWNQRFLALRGHYAFHATACTPATPREKGSVEGGVRHLKTGFWPARRFACLAELDEQYARLRDSVCNRRVHATGRFAIGERLAHEREVLRPLPPTRFDFAGARPVRVGLDGYLKLGGNFYRAPLGLVHQRVELRFDRDHVWIRHAGETVATYLRSYDRGQWFPPPQLRPEPPAAAPVARFVVPQVMPPELADYAELCA